MYISYIFHVVCASFSALATQKLADGKAVYSGIQALVFIPIQRELCPSFYFMSKIGKHDVHIDNGTAKISEQIHH